MNRSDIPFALRMARGDDIDQIPDAALAKMCPADVAPRLLAAGEMRRRSLQRHLTAAEGDYYGAQAIEVLTTADQERAKALIKAAGIATADHDPMTGTHTHSHPAFGSQGGDADHEHEHTHDNDADHHHAHAAKSAKAVPPVMSGALRKAAPGPAPDAQRSITVSTPALDEMGNSKSLLEGLNKLSRQGRLGEAAKELAAVALAAERPGLLTKAAEAERLAGRVSSPAEQQTYLKLAAKWRQEAGAA